MSNITLATENTKVVISERKIELDATTININN